MSNLRNQNALQHYRLQKQNTTRLNTVQINPIASIMSQLEP